MSAGNPLQTGDYRPNSFAYGSFFRPYGRFRRFFGAILGSFGRSAQRCRAKLAYDPKPAEQ
jgi:hypothetical protein